MSHATSTLKQQRDDIVVVDPPLAATDVEASAPPGGGRPLPAAVRRQIERVLAETARIVTDPAIAIGATCATETEADAALQRATDELSHRARQTSWRRGPRLVELIDTLVAAQDARAALAEVRAARRNQRADRVGAALERLWGLASRAQLSACAPAEFCSCDFDRVILTSLDRAGCRLVSFAAAGGGQARRALAAALEAPLAPLSHKTHEADAVRRRSAVLVNGPGRLGVTAHETMARLGARSYVVAPVIAGEDVIALVHADTLRGPCDPEDREVLGALAVGLGRATTQLALSERLEQVGGLVRRFTANVHDELEATLSMPCVLRPVGEEARPPARQPAPRLEQVLTRREVEVLGLLADGETNREIAARLVVSEGTVKSHVKSILRKLHASNRADAVGRYLRLQARPAFP